MRKAMLQHNPAYRYLKIVYRRIQAITNIAQSSVLTIKRSPEADQVNHQVHRLSHIVIYHSVDLLNQVYNTTTEQGDHITAPTRPIKTSLFASGLWTSAVRKYFRAILEIKECFFSAAQWRLPRIYNPFSPAFGTRQS